MITPPSAAFATAAAATYRVPRLKVDVLWTDPFVMSGNVVTSADTNNFGDLDSEVIEDFLLQVVNTKTATPHKYIVNDGTWINDGTWYPVPGTVEEAAENEVGWYTDEVAGSSGVFATPPELTVTFSEVRPITQIVIAGELTINEYPADFDVYVYDTDSNVLNSVTHFENTDLIKYIDFSEDEIIDAKSIKLVLNTWSRGDTIGKIAEFFGVITDTFYSDDVVSMDVLEEIEAEGSTSAFGAMTCNELNMEFQNVSMQRNTSTAVWNSRASVEDNLWKGITYGNGLYVAVAGSGTYRVMTSPDGVTWTPRAVPLSDWRAVTYGNGLFVAVASSQTVRIMTSPDGITWTPQTPSMNWEWSGICYGAGKFVAVAYDGIAYSANGIDWTIATTDIDGLVSVCFFDGKFFAISGQYGDVHRSADGEDWETVGDTLNFASCICGGNGVLLMTSYYYNWPMGAISTDEGETWNTIMGLTVYNARSCTYGDGLFVVVGNHDESPWVATSPDAINWTVEEAAAGNEWYGVCYGVGKFVAVASSGTGDRVMTRDTVVIKDGETVQDPFLPENTASYLKNSITPNVRLTPYIGFMLSDGSVEYVKMGVYWSTDWDVSEASFSASVTARDRFELLRQNIFRQNEIWSDVTLKEVAEMVLDSAKKYIPLGDLEWSISDDLSDYTVNNAWFGQVTYFEALSQIAKACFGRVYCDRDGKIIIETYKSNQSTGSPDFTVSKYFDSSRSMCELKNYVIVPVCNLIPENEADDIYASPEITVTSDTDEIVQHITWEDDAVIDHEIVITKQTLITVTVISQKFYAWGADITFFNYSGTTGSFEYKITGKKLELSKTDDITSQDSDLIRLYNKREENADDNFLIQTYEMAQDIADAALTILSDVRRDIDVEVPGNPCTEIGDIANIMVYKKLDKYEEFRVIRQQFNADSSGLRCKLTGRKTIDYGS